MLRVLISTRGSRRRWFARIANFPCCRSSKGGRRDEDGVGSQRYRGLSGLAVPGASLPPGERVEIRAEGLFLNGAPFFPVGIDHAAHWHLSLPEAGEKGFNLVTTHGLGADPQSFRADIDDAYANGMYAAAALTNGVWEDLERVEQIVLACRDAPGLLAWEFEHEPDLRLSGPEHEDTPHADRPYRMPPEDFVPAYELVKRLDPVHPVRVELSYGRLRDHQAYRGVADILSDLCRPVPRLPLVSVAQYSDAVVEGAAGKPGWMVLQMMSGSGPGGERHPTMTEVRCMTYLAVVHGISGVIYKAFHYGEWWVTDKPAYWAQWSDLTTELRCLTPYLVAPPANGRVKAEINEGSREPGAGGYTALHYSLRQTEGCYFLIVVNGFDSPVRARFTVPVPASGLADRAAVRFENRLVDVEEGVFDDFFAPHAVHLYEIPFTAHLDRETAQWPRWQRRAKSSILG